MAVPSNPFAAGVDLADIARGVGGFKITPEARGTGFGSAVGSMSVAAGDTNGDGVDDLVLGAPNFSTLASFAGAAYVVFGKDGGLGNVALTSVAATTGGFRITPTASGGFLGGSVSGAGDIDGDRRDDVILGGQDISLAGIKPGAAFIVYYRASGPALTTIAGEADGDQAGKSVAGVGDVNGDGRPDVLVGASSNGAGDRGAAYVVFGKSGGLGSGVALSSIAAGSGGFKILGESGGAGTGRTLAAAGDMNGDGLADLIVGAPEFSDAGGINRGATYVVFGKKDGASVDLSAVAVGSGGFKILGEGFSDGAGSSVSSAGDVNGDGIVDLIVGAGFMDTSAGDDSGAAYVVFGKRDGTLVNLSDVASGTGGFKIIGEEAGDAAGYSVSAAGDINGDGLADVIVGAPRNASNGAYSGAAYVVYGKRDGTPVDLAAVALGTGGFKIRAEGDLAQSGTVVSSAGDVNNDGADDLFVGGPGAGRTSAAGYVIYAPEGPLRDATAGADSIRGTLNSDTIDLLAGNDAFNGRDGNDTIRGNAGADWLRGDIGDDTFLLGGSAGPDLVAPANSTVRNPDMVGSNGAADAVSVAGRHVVLDVIDGGEGNDVVIGSSQSDVVVLSAPGSAVYAGQNANVRLVSVERFELGDGNDVLSLTTTNVANRIIGEVTALGGRGNDTMFGGAGTDRLFGEEGNDFLVGGLNVDILDGGAGSDIFGFGRNSSRDFVADFTPGQDKLRIKGFGTSLDTFDEISGLIAQGDFDNDGAFDDTRIAFAAGGTEIVLVNFMGRLTATDFQIVA